MIYQLYNVNKYLLFTIIVILTLASMHCNQVYLPIEELMYSNLSEQMSAERVIDLIDSQSKYKWLGYVLTPFLLIIKWFLITCVLITGAIFMDKKYEFTVLFSIVMFSELVFILMGIVKFLWLFTFASELTLDYLQSFTPLSLINFFDYKTLPKLLIYSMQIFNLFEISSWILIAYLIAKKFQIKLDVSFNFFMTSYFPALVLWVTTVSFLILNFS